jgi:aldehyde dehydrogenase (NAD+)
MNARHGVWSCDGAEEGAGGVYHALSPIDGSKIGSISLASDEQYDRTIAGAHRTFFEWRNVPAPERGQLIREIAEELRRRKGELGLLITSEVGKIRAEGEGEIQEAIDIAEFALGLSRQMYGRTMYSERRDHRMFEQWHPLGVVGVITAFNFPAAVWAWNAFIAAVCGDTVVWKPSERGLATAIAMTELCGDIATRWGFPGLFSLVSDVDARCGIRLAEDPRIALLSATGSVAMGRSVAETVGRRLGRTLLELGGNNAVIVMDDADLDLAVRSILFGAVGTAGQRCTTTRRLFVQRRIIDEFQHRLVNGYRQVRIGDPRESHTLMGPLISEQSVRHFEKAVAVAQDQGATVIVGGKRLHGMASQLYVEPTILRVNHPIPIMREETFAPVLYLCPFNDFEEAVFFQNDVPQGLSSAIFTNSMSYAERFVSSVGSDCGIANVNLGTSGAEIGGAFGGEKETGGGRESGSDSWKQYMRRQTNTINFGSSAQLAQGIVFGGD